jgi:hypothetical protein
MSKRKSTTEETSAREPALPEVPAIQETPPATEPAAEAAAPLPPYAAVAAPERAGSAYTVDNRLGYRKEDTADGKRQLRFAARPDGSRPDDELLAPVRGKKHAVGWSARAKAWQAQKNAAGFAALDEADQELRDIGRHRSERRER